MRKPTWGPKQRIEGKQLKAVGKASWKRFSGDLANGGGRETAKAKAQRK